MIRLTLDKKGYMPGDKLTGTMEWSNDGTVPKTVGVRLGWHTRGKGDMDSDVVEEIPFTPAASGNQRFSCTLPEGPYSFYGTLISLIWEVEGYMDDGMMSKEKSLAERILLTSDGKEVNI